MKSQDFSRQKKEDWENYGRGRKEDQQLFLWFLMYVLSHEEFLDLVLKEVNHNGE